MAANQVENMKNILFIILSHSYLSMLLDLSLNITFLIIDPILEAKGQVVMPAKSNSIDQRDYDRIDLLIRELKTIISKNLYLYLQIA